jgi:alpha-D-ribose 1-methylphosphonate 5-triphosphate synthase subunit PhnG
MTQDHDTARQRVMRVLSQASAQEIADVLSAGETLPDAVDMRAPEIGLAMVRGRIGGDGQPFNVGEASVTRAAVRLPDGTVGVSYRLGRDPKTARLCAVIDAAWQQPVGRARIEAQVIAPLAALALARQQAQAERVAATRVDFFTMVRGEDAA